MSGFWNKYPEISGELNDVKNIIKKNIKGSDIYLDNAITPLVEQGGKMLRPAFVLLSAKFGECDGKKIKNIAAVVEMLHLATLIHDDIIDNSKLRRGSETIQSKYGKDFAVYAGDYLFCTCFNMLARNDYTVENMKNLSMAIKKICIGEIRQNYFRYTTKINLNKYIRIVSGKTAALFSLSFMVGSSEAKCDPSMVRKLGNIGYNIGMAFQIIDDLLDYTGDIEKLGKSTQSDLKQGYYTLPIILALEEDKNRELANILDNATFTGDESKKILELVKKLKGIEKSKLLVERYSKKAFKSIEKLPECESKTILLEVLETLIHRKY